MDLKINLVILQIVFKVTKPNKFSIIFFIILPFNLFKSTKKDKFSEEKISKTVMCFYNNNQTAYIMTLLEYR